MSPVQWVRRHLAAISMATALALIAFAVTLNQEPVRTELAWFSWSWSWIWGASGGPFQWPDW